MSTAVPLIRAALRGPELKQQPVDLPPLTACAITGAPIARGYRVMDVVSAATSEYFSLLEDPSGFVCEDAAWLLANDWNLGGRMVFEDAHFYPRLGATKDKDAEEDPKELGARAARLRERDAGATRPTWSQLARDIWPERAGQRCVVLVSADPKKRAWPRAMLTTLGQSTMVTGVSDTFTGTRTIDWMRLLRILDAAEVWLSLGFTKYTCRQSLLQASFSSDATKPAFPTYAELERLRARIGTRHPNELELALLIAIRGNVAPGALDHALEVTRNALD